MTNAHESKSVGGFSEVSAESSSLVPALSTRVVWATWLASIVALVGSVRYGWTPIDVGPFAVDGLAVLMWAVVTFFSGIVHSYARRYMAGTRNLDGFYGRVLGFTLTVMVLSAADALVVFALAWLAMGLVMADLVGHVDDWRQARSAARIARTYFLGSTLALSAALAILWYETGAATISGILTRLDAVPTPALVIAAAALVLAATIQAALLPFQRWLLSSMTAPTPASALMHAGFVNAGGFLLTRFAPLVSTEGRIMLAIVLIGGFSALAGKLLKSVRTDVKSKLGCSTVGQMGFMLMQAGLGFFGAAMTHLILHGFYKAYMFLSSGDAVEHAAPGKGASASPGVGGLVATVAMGVAGGGLFALLTGEGTHLGSGLLLALFVTLTTLHATRDVVGRESLPATLRLAVFPAVFLAAIAVYATVYTAIETVLDGVVTTAPTALTPVHALVALAFVGTYLAVEMDWHRSSTRLYVALLNRSQPAGPTVLTDTEDYDEY
ncbi:MAG: proton-conducting transporter membrane subunit [Haloarculaceae archaeon]